MYTNHATAYKQTRVKTAGSGQLIVMLYDEAIKQIDAAYDLLSQDTRALDKVNNALIKARDVITELMVSLNVEEGGEFAQNLMGLYVWFNQQLLEANLKKDESLLPPVRRFLADLREAWAQIAGKASGGQESRGINVAG